MPTNANPDPDYFGNTGYSLVLFLWLFLPHNIVHYIIAFRLEYIDF
jgi:hypothetical protein